MLIDNPAPFEILLIEDEPADAKLEIGRASCWERV